VNNSYLQLGKNYSVVGFNHENNLGSYNNKIKIKNKTSKKFYIVLANAWLQLYDSKNKKDPLAFNNENFHFENKDLVFKVCGSKKRVELRFKEEWRINENKNIKVKVKFNPLDSEEFTFLQILSYDLNKGSKYYKPLLRIHWNKNYKGKENHIWATLRLSLYENKFKKFDLGDYNGDYIDVLVKINNKTLKVYINNELKIEEKIENWEYTNYFKAGVYIQKGGCAEAKFEKIIVNDDKELKLQNKLETIKKYPINWFWKLENALTNEEIEQDYYLYDIDLFDNSKETIKKLKEKGKIVICYFSFGTYEDWREDTNSISRELLGNKLDNWEGERWWDIRNKGIINLLKKRIDLAKEKGCDGIEMDNIDIYKNNNGLGIKKEDVIRAFKELSEYAKSEGLLVVLKNSPELIEELKDYYDLILAEECFEFNECNQYLKSNKPIIDVEYNLNKNQFCKEAKKLKISAVKACYELNGCWNPCFK
jgi:uncharacterized protein (TIGR01370 family)